MQNLFILSMLMMIHLTIFGQGVGINQSGTPADPSAMLDISSTTKGILIPRMNTAHRIGINLPAQGLMVYDTDSRTFWFYDGAWKEISTGAGGVNGPASGDLSGSYPSPNVVKLQNLDVASGVPFDHQVLKWDALANNWKGRNDSLFLPYNVAYGSATKLFGIQNNNTTSGSSAIYGRSGSTGSGITPATTMGVWGDNSSNGLGVVGTSNAGIGVYGLSFGNHGVYGYSTLANFAGVCGSNANANGIGVLGDIQNTGKAIYGRSTGVSGKAGVFESTNTTFADTTFLVNNSGYGSAGYMTNSNQTNSNAILEVSSHAHGDGIYSELLNTGNYANANFRAYNQSLGGYAFYGQTDLGNACYLYNTGVTNNSYVLDAKTVGLASVGNFTISNATNNNYILQGTTNGLGGGLNLSMTNTSASGTGINVTHSGTGNGLVVSAKKGKAGVFSNTDATNNLNVMEVTSIGTNRAALFTTNNDANSTPTVSLTNNGTGRGLESILSNSSNNAAAVYGSSSGNKGVEGLALNQGVTGQSTTLTGGIGVFGQSALNSPAGIGVKGISYSTNFTSGAITGIGNSTGVAVYGESTAGGIALYGKTTRQNGAAVYGINDATQGHAIQGSATGTDGVAIYGEAGNSSSNSIAAYLRNTNIQNSNKIVWITSNGTGNTMFLENTNGANNTDMILGRNVGTGNFLRLNDSGNNEVTTIAKNGNIKTDGTVTVKGDKGIIRNSSATQLRTEIITANIPAGSLSHYNSNFNGGIFVPITFGTAFSSPPSVYIGNLISGTILGLTMTIEDVTTTGFTLVLGNYTSSDFTIDATQYKLIAIGAE